MPRPLPAFPVTTVGSWPRPAALLTAMKRRSADAGALADEAVVAAVRAQEEAGADLITDGEQRRDNFTSFLSERVQGFDRMSMADLLDHVEDKAAFETLLRTRRACLRHPQQRGGGAVEGDPPARARRHGVPARHHRPADSATLPGPYILVRSSWVEALRAPLSATGRSSAMTW
ncbi:MAG: hypothetical protein R3F17_16550 [Planctomycetota bacterium]